MGKLKVIKTGPMATIQDLGRFGYRRYGIPQSGAMDIEMMKVANQLVGNPDDFPVVEFAMLGMKMEVMERTAIALVGASFTLNGDVVNQNGLVLDNGDIIELSAPDRVYAYLGISGKIKCKEDFGSTSTYLMAGFGGIDGKALRSEDVLIAIDSEDEVRPVGMPDWSENPSVIRIMKGPEWDVLQELPDLKTFKIDPSSNRMGIRLTGNRLENDGQEIASSAVVPGTIQLPSDGQPIILMNDCQTTGGYPRIGKVIEEDMGKLAQVRPGEKIKFVLADS